MFQLIVAVISIALVAALALASIFYGGEAFTRSQLKAQVTTMINQAQQISGAQTLYKTDKGGSVAATVVALKDAAYLAEVPTAPSKITTSSWGLDNTATVGTGLHPGTAYVGLIDDAGTLDKINTLVTDQGTGTVDLTAKAFYFKL
jgi:type II secretory pathway pseudopilin PulG